MRATMMQAVVALLSLTAMVSLGIGCASSNTSSSNYAYRYAKTTPREALFEKAARVLIDRGYAIDRINRDTGYILTMPKVAHDSADRAAGGAFLSSVASSRRLVSVRIGPGPDKIKVGCRVLIQRQVTQAYRMAAPDHRGEDSPTTTPIDRDAATTPEQNAVWKNVRRDRAAERVILVAILPLVTEAP